MSKFSLMVGAAVSAGLVGTAAVHGADYIIGDWETGTDGWVSHQAGPILTPGVTTGATHGVGAMKVVPGAGYSQNLKLSLNDTGQRQAFMANTHFSVDVTWDIADWEYLPAAPATWSKIEDIVINAEGSNWRGYKSNPLAHFTDTGNPGYWGGWDNTNFGSLHTRTLTMDYSFLKDGVNDPDNGNYEVTTHLPGYNFPNWVEFVFITTFDNNFNPAKAAFYFDNAKFFTPAVNGSWTGTTSSAWSTGTNWAGGAAPGGIDHTATFGASSQYNVVVDAAKTVGTMTFDSPTSYTVSGSTITFEATAGTPAIAVFSGNHTISAPLVLNNWLFPSAVTGSTLSLTGPITSTPAGRGFVKQGGGVVSIEQLDTGTLRVDGGTLRVSHKGAANSASGTTAADTLTIASGAVLDLTNNSLVVDYDTVSPLADVSLAISSGYAGGAWTGAGLTSSTAAGSSRTGLGYAEASALGITGSFNGQSFTGDAVLVMYTLYGDTDLSGSVNLDDFTRLASGFGNSGTWVTGDSNYDGVTNLDDFTAMASNFGLTVSAGMARSTVPEPGSIAALAAGTVAMLLRRRRA